jgi:hypothetical protein
MAGGYDISAGFSGSASSGASNSGAMQGGGGGGNSKYNYGASVSAVPYQTWLVFGGVAVAALAVVGGLIYFIWGRK